MALRLAMLHYHLRPGGVTTVIRNAQRALAGKFDVTVLADFGYDERSARSQAEFLAGANLLANQLRQRLSGVDVLHTHNIGLGKHPRLTYAVRLLAHRGRIKIINQVHDFPEDNRPAQLHALRHCTGKFDDRFWRGMCYYDASNVVWATLTTHDATKLASRGVPSQKIHVLPNPVDDEFFTRPPPLRPELQEVKKKLAAFARAHRFPFNPRKKLLLSPMKVMVRKNNEEAVELVKRLREISTDHLARRILRHRPRVWRAVEETDSPGAVAGGDRFRGRVGQPVAPFSHGARDPDDIESGGIRVHVCRRLVMRQAGDWPRYSRSHTRFRRGRNEDGPLVSTNLTMRPCAASRHFSPHLRANSIEHNRQVVLKKYSLRAYARRYGKLLASFRR